MLRSVVRRSNAALSLVPHARAFAAAGAPLGNPFDFLKEAKLDMNHATMSAYEADPSPLKINLGRGVYKDDRGKSWTLPAVRMAEEEIAKKDHGHEYLPFSGWPTFVQETTRFAWGDGCPLVAEGRVATVQTISGTGALRVATTLLADLMRAAHWRAPVVYMPDPTYVNHYKIAAVTGFEVKHYRYYDSERRAVDVDGMVRDLVEAPSGSFVLMHACAHNPTGCDPTPDEWARLADVFLEKGHIAFFDSAYQGYASGDPDRDAFSYRHFQQRGVKRIVLAQSFAKNFGLYGQRVGALHVTCANPAETKLLMNTLNGEVIRPMYSNPPTYGARIVGTVLSTPHLRAQWNKDVRTMADRINGCRRSLVQNLAELGSRRDWSHITRQIGMFAYSGLSQAEVECLRTMHVYMNLDGRMSISGINSGNVRYLAESIHKATSQ
jgi:aspartate aminotransferase